MGALSARRGRGGAVQARGALRGTRGGTRTHRRGRRRVATAWRRECWRVSKTGGGDARGRERRRPGAPARGHVAARARSRPKPPRPDRRIAAAALRARGIARRARCGAGLDHAQERARAEKAFTSLPRHQQKRAPPTERRRRIMCTHRLWRGGRVRCWAGESGRREKSEAGRDPSEKQAAVTSPHQPTDCQRSAAASALLARRGQRAAASAVKTREAARRRRQKNTGEMDYRRATQDRRVVKIQQPSTQRLVQRP